MCGVSLTFSPSLSLKHTHIFASVKDISPRLGEENEFLAMHGQVRAKVRLLPRATGSSSQLQAWAVDQSGFAEAMAAGRAGLKLKPGGRGRAQGLPRGRYGMKQPHPEPRPAAALLPQRPEGSAGPPPPSPQHRGAGPSAANPAGLSRSGLPAARPRLTSARRCLPPHPGLRHQGLGSRLLAPLRPAGPERPAPAPPRQPCDGAGGTGGRGAPRLRPAAGAGTGNRNGAGWGPGGTG